MERAGTQDSPTSHGRTGADGRFQLGGLRSDLPHALVVLADGWARLVVDFAYDLDHPSRRRTSGTSCCARAAGSRGGSWTPTASPPRVCRSRARGPVPDAAGPAWPGVLAMYARDERLVTDDLGRFTFPDLSPGTYVVGALPSRGEPIRREVVLPEDADLDDLELRLPRAPETGPISEWRVLVLDPDGAPCPGVFVSAGRPGARGSTR